MQPRKFNTYIDNVHQRWLAVELGLQVNPSTGVDLLGQISGVEVKARLLRNGTAWSIAVHDYQFREFPAQHSGLRLYWAFLYYTLSKPVQKVQRKDIAGLEGLVSSRETFIVPWAWMARKKVHHTKTGPYRYAWRRLLQPTANVHQTAKGPIYLPAGF